MLTTRRPSPARLEQTHLLPSRILNPHARFYVREVRILAYAQLLESYRSLTLESMGLAFGVSVEFIDKYVFPPTPGSLPWTSLTPIRTLQ